MLLAGITLLIILLLVGFALWGLICFAMARILLMPERMSEGRALAILRRLSPGDLGLPFTRLDFVVHDQQQPGRNLRLAAWWIPAPINLGRCVLIIHGYSDAKVGGIAWAPTFLSLGWNVLAIDLRAHGESEGLQSTAGFYERHDVSEIIDLFLAEKPAYARQLVIFGVSMGAAVAAAVADLRQGHEIQAIILDCPFADFTSAAQTHAEFHGLPGKVFQVPALRLAQRISGADFGAVAPEKLIPTLPCPLMVIHGADDLFVTPADMDRVEQAVQKRSPELGPTIYWRSRDTHHVLALRTDPLEFAQRIGEFLDQAVAWQNSRTVIQPDTAKEKP